MRRNFWGANEPYHELRAAFVHKRLSVRTPDYLCGAPDLQPMLAPA
jgi:hypothetical protein